jgi:hypothetical protein
MNSREEQEVYKQKYLKYKIKYLEAKNNLEGGMKCGKYIYFLNFPDKLINAKDDAIQKIIDEFVKVISPENDDDQVMDKINKLCNTINFKYELKRDIFTKSKDNDHAVKCAYIEISLTGITFHMHQLNNYRNDNWIRVNILTKGATENEKGELISNTELLSNVHRHYTFNYYFVKNYSCFGIGKNAKKDIKLIKYEHVDTKQEKLKTFLD